MADVVQCFTRGLDHFGGLVHAIGPEDWTRDTPCREWDVRALLNHLVVEQLWAPPLLEGQTIAEVGDKFDGDVLGRDPVAAWDSSAADARAAFSAPGAMDRTVHLSFGDTPAEEYGWQMTMDLLIHGWDLARGIGADDTMDPEIVVEVYERIQPMTGDLAASGMFDAPVEVADDADLAVRLLAIFGRRA